MDDRIGNIIHSIGARGLQQDAKAEDLSSVDATIRDLEKEVFSGETTEAPSDDLMQKVSNIEPGPQDSKATQALKRVKDILHCSKVLAMGDDKAQQELENIGDLTLRIKTSAHLNMPLKDELFDKKEIQHVDEEGNTLLHILVKNGDIKTIRWAIRLGIDVNKPNKAGETPLDIAAVNKNVEMAKDLIDNRAKEASLPTILFLRDVLPAKDFDKAVSKQWDFHQGKIITRLIEYLQLRNPELWGKKGRKKKYLEMGVCHGLTTLYCYYQFLGKENVFFERLNKTFSVDFDKMGYLKDTCYSDLTEDQKELEHLCNDVLYLHKPLQSGGQSYPARDLSFLSDTTEIKPISSRFYFAATFSRDVKTSKYEGLITVLSRILFADTDKPKFLFLSTGDHKIGIFCKENKCFFYDPNNKHIPPSFDISTPSYKGIRQLVAMLIAVTFAGQDTVTLGIDVIAQEDLPKTDMISLHELYQTNGLHLAAGDRGFTPLWVAAQNGHVKAVEILADALIKKSASVDAPNNKGFTPLWIAAQNGHLEVVEALIGKDAKVDEPGKDGVTPLWVAAQNGHLEVVEALIGKDAKVDEPDKDGVTPLWVAAQNGRAEVVKALIAKGAKVDKSNNSGRTPLWVAAQNGHLEVVEALIGKDAKVDEPDKDGVTPLWVAAQNGHLEVVKALIAKGAKVDKSNNSGRTPLCVAAQNGHLEVVEALIGKDAKVDEPDKDGVTPLWVAAQNGHLEVVEALIGKDAKVDEPDKDGFTPLWIAAQNGHLEVVEALIGKDAKVDEPDKDGVTPLWVAAQNGYLEVVEALIGKDAKVDEPDKDGFTPLFVAAQNGRAEVVKALIAKGAKVDKPNNSGRTPLWIAAEDGRVEVVEALVGGGASPDRCSRRDDNPFLLAVNNGSEKIMEILANALITKKGSIDKPDKYGQTFLGLAARAGHKGAVESLIDKGASVDKRDHKGRTPLWVAAENGHEGVVKYLIEKGASVDKRDHKGRTPLMLAVRQGHKGVVEKLIRNGADVGKRSFLGTTPLKIALKSGYTEIADLLREAGAQ